MSTQDSDARPEPTIEEKTLAEVSDLAQDIRRFQEETGQPLLTGPASVMLTLPVEEAMTPQEAVERVISTIAHTGLDGFTFAVVDKLTGDEYFVQGNRLFSLDDVKSMLGQRETLEPKDKDDGDGSPA